MKPQQPTVALAISGGNALGAYAAGAYQALHDRGFLPHVVSGASIGAVTGGLIVGNPPERRIENSANSGGRRASEAPSDSRPLRVEGASTTTRRTHCNR